MKFRVAVLKLFFVPRGVRQRKGKKRNNRKKRRKSNRNWNRNTKNGIGASNRFENKAKSSKNIFMKWINRWHDMQTIKT